MGVGSYRLRKETLPDHPPEGDTRQAVRRVVRHGAATNIYATKQGGR